jgi:hypothetical protein
VGNVKRGTYSDSEEKVALFRELEQNVQKLNNKPSTPYNYAKSCYDSKNKEKGKGHPL